MLFGGARPILPGRTERALRLADELRDHQAEYEALNARYGIRAHAMWVSHLVSGLDLWMTIYDMEPEHMAAMRTRTWDPAGSAYDRWWLEWVRDVLGVDMLVHNGYAAPPEPIFEWRTPS
jgi:hypothetical protein